MKKRLLFIIPALASGLFCGPLHARQAPPTPMDSFTVCFFLLEDCMITQAYTDVLQSLYREYANDSIGFWGGFPNPVSDEGSMEGFVKKYGLPFPCSVEGAHQLAKAFAVSVTPEVVVFNETAGRVVYQGRIDNLFERVGKRRRVVTFHELKDALEAIRTNVAVPVARTTAVGCILN
ncbi:MAG: hypothetical protein ACOYOO_07270 [Saprospiraceae bacterium]